MHADNFSGSGARQILHLFRSSGILVATGEVMADQTSPFTSRLKRRWPRRVLFVFLVLGCVYAVYHYTLHFMVEAKLDEIRKQGYPVTLAELDKWYQQVPREENAANVYEQAFVHYDRWKTNELVTQISGEPLEPKYRLRETNTGWIKVERKIDLLPVIGKAKLPSRSEALSNDVKNLIADFLADNAESLRLLHKAATVKQCRYPINLNDGGDTLLPHLNDLRDGARLLALQCILQAEEGEDDSASFAVVDGLNLARSLDQEPSEVSQLARIGCQSITLSGFEQMLNRVPLSNAELSSLTAALRDAEDSQGMTRALVGEACLSNAEFGMSAWKLSFRQNRFWLPRWSAYIVAPLAMLYRGTGLMDMDHLSFLRGIEDLHQGCSDASPVWVKSQRTV